MPNRALRHAALATLTALALGCVPGCAATGHSSASPTAMARTVNADKDFTALEGEYDARLGVWALDTGSNRTVAWRADERFAYASTFKALACAVILQRDSADQLDKVVTYGSAELLDPSPITQQHLNTGMTVRELCDAAIRYSDNTAGNLLLREIGGPDGLNASLKQIGDDTTHADRSEPDLNSAVPGDVRDTTTPRAIGTDLMRFLLKDED